jgi:four helix bundle protein
MATSRVFRYHLEVALGSQAEIEVQVEIARQLGFIDDARYETVRHRVDLVGRLLNRLLDSLQDRQPSSTAPTNPHPRDTNLHR